MTRHAYLAVAPAVPLSVVIPVTEWHLPLQLAALCVNCDHLFDVRAGDCPSCTSSCNLNLADILEAK